MLGTAQNCVEGMTSVPPACISTNSTAEHCRGVSPSLVIVPETISPSTGALEFVRIGAGITSSAERYSTLERCPCCEAFPLAHPPSTPTSKNNTILRTISCPFFRAQSRLRAAAWLPPTPRTSRRRLSPLRPIASAEALPCVWAALPAPAFFGVSAIAASCACVLRKNFAYASAAFARTSGPSSKLKTSSKKCICLRISGALSGG